MDFFRSLAALLLLSSAAQGSRSVYHRMLSISGAGVRVGWTSGPGDVLGNGTSTVEFGLSPHVLGQRALGENWTWVDYDNPFGGTNRTYTHHLVELPALQAGATYFYRCGDPADGWSAVASFTAPRAVFLPDAPLRIAVFGDMGWTNAQTLPNLQDEALRGGTDLFLNLGDYAYNLCYRDGAVGDNFQANLESITSTGMYQGVVGNHEALLSFTHYTHRFRVFTGASPSSGLMPDLPGIVGGLPNNHYYSFDVGAGTPQGVHVLALSSEAYFYYNASAAQLAWARADLAAVDRKRTPWVVAAMHRTLYCSCDTDCDGDAAAMRDGPLGLEALLVGGGVDLVLAGHEHNTERMYAVRGGTVVTGPASGRPGGNASAPEVLVDPAAPVYVVSGCAGNVEQHEPFLRPQPPITAFRADTYGWARLTVHNASALLLELVQADADQPAPPGAVIDAMLLRRTRYGA